MTAEDMHPKDIRESKQIKAEELSFDDVIKRSARKISVLHGRGSRFLSVLRQKQRLDEKQLIAYFFVRKSDRILTSINTLILDDYIEEAQILCRALLETLINLDYFLKMEKEIGFKKAYERMKDGASLSLEFENANSINSLGPKKGENGIDNKERDKSVAEIRARYSKDDFRRLKRHGYSGVDMRVRATNTNNLKYYEPAYGLFSRSVHGKDLDEHLLEIVDASAFVVSRRLRLLCLLRVSTTCASEIINKCNNWVGNQGQIIV